MKTSATILFFLLASTTFGQHEPSKEKIAYKDSIYTFKLTFSTFNHAELIFEGAATYQLTESSISIKKKFFLDTSDKVVYKRKIQKSRNCLLAITQLRLDTLKDYYFNYCVMITSGNEYFLDYSSNSETKHITLHHYYLKQLDDIIQIFNANLPKKYRIDYLTKDEKQGCSLSDIMKKQ